MGKRGPKPQPKKMCSESGCRKYAVALGLCSTHWARQHRHGGRTKNFHRISRLEIDADSFRGTCSVCGPNTKIYWRRDRNTWECSNSAGRIRHHEKRRNGELGKLLKNKDGTFLKVTPRELFIAWINQNGKCPGCQRSLSGIAKRHHHADHDHTTKTFRGILCGKCNGVIGLADDNIETLENLIQYLKESKEK